MMRSIVLWLVACRSSGEDVPTLDADPPRPASGLAPGTTTPSAYQVDPPPGSVIPAGMALTVDPLVIGTPIALSVVGAPIGASITVWRGTFDGTSCPEELAGDCVPLGDALAIASGVADASGRLLTSWTVPTKEPLGSYAVFVATTDTAMQTLPVMRRVWEHVPDWPHERFLFDPFDDLVTVPPGDWMDLRLRDEGDDYEVFTLGNESFTARTLFHGACGDLYPWLIAPPASETALVSARVYYEEGGAGVTFDGHSLATGSWWFELAPEYGEDLGVYDLVVRVHTPTDPAVWYTDADADGWGDDTAPVESPTAPADAVYRSGDCDDSDLGLNPDAWDVCGDGIDHDCSGTDKPCRAGPTGEGIVATFAGLHAGLELGNPVDVAAVGDADADGIAELWLRAHDEAIVLDAVPGSQVVPPLLVNDHGFGASRAGDFDHDGVSDVAWGGGDLEAEGAVSIVRTPTDPTAIEPNAWATLVGPSPGDDAGTMLDSSGDVDGDGWRDLLVGAGNTNTVWLLTSVAAGRSDLDTAATATLLYAGDQGVLSAAADFDGDGISDVTVGSNRTNAYVALGPVTGSVELVIESDTKFTLPGALEPQLSTGDTDGDGADEVLLSSPEVASAWLFEGPLAAAVDATAAVSVITSTGIVESHAIGDLDGDGNDDLAIADPHHGDGMTGSVSVVYGPLPATMQVPLDADLALYPAEDEITGRGLWFVDADGDGGDDLVIGSGRWTVDILFGVPSVP